MLAEGEVSAVYEDGEMVGVQFDAIREGGLYDRIGLRNGDVVTEINGVSLADPAAAAKVIGELVAAPELSIAVERGADGAPETLVVRHPLARDGARAAHPGTAARQIAESLHPNGLLESDISRVVTF